MSRFTFLSVAIECKTIPVQVEKGKLARAPRRVRQMGSLVKNAVFFILPEERVRIINHKSKHKRSCLHALEVDLVMPLEMHFHAVAAQSHVVGVSTRAVSESEYESQAIKIKP